MTDECNAWFPNNWQVIYACVEALESALLKMRGVDPAWKPIIAGGVDPENPDNNLMGLKELHNYHSPKFTHNGWCN